MSRESDRDRAEKGESENEESMDFMSSQFSDFQEQYSSWENPSDMVQISGDTDVGTQDSEMVQISEDTDVGTQDSVMVRVSQASSELVRVPSEYLASIGTQESSEHCEKSDTDSSYSPGTCILLHTSIVYTVMYYMYPVCTLFPLTCVQCVHCFLLHIYPVCTLVFLQQVQVTVFCHCQCLPSRAYFHGIA